MTRHAFSHATATLVSLVAANLFIDRVREKVPELTERLERASEILVVVLDLTYPVEHVTQMLLAVCLAFVWGLAFSIASRTA